MTHKIDDQIIIKRKQQLEKEKERLEAEIKSLKNYKGYDLGYTNDDNALELEMFQNNIGLVNSLNKSLKEVNSALRRIQTGKFGLCDLCGGFIESARLEISPESDFCASCAAQKKPK